MSAKTYYEVLGLTKTCTPQEIKKGYHQLALIWHPDKHTNKEGAQQEFTLINEAYTVLSDANKRGVYDLFGKQGLTKEKDAQSSTTKTNVFCKRGFNGTDKSAFDILRGIFNENEDDQFVKSCEASGYSKSLHSSLKSFVHETIISSDEDCTNFLADYQPTFMNPKFAEQLNSLDQIVTSKEALTTNILSSIIANARKNQPDQATNKRKRKNSFLVAEESDKRGFPFKVLKATKNKSLKTNLLKTLKNNKRPFLIHDEDEEEITEDEPFMEFVQPRFLRRQSYRSEAIEESDYIAQNLVEMASSIRPEKSANLEDLCMEKLSKKIKTQTLV